MRLNPELSYMEHSYGKIATRVLCGKEKEQFIEKEDKAERVQAYNNKPSGRIPTDNDRL